MRSFLPGAVRKRIQTTGLRFAQVLALGLIAIIHASNAMASCSASTQAVDFGSYDVFSGTPLDGAGAVEASCSPAAAYTISISSGGGSYTQRELTGGALVMNYNLYTNASHSVIWGDGTGSTSVVAGSGDGELHTIYGRAPAGQNLPAGSYSDTLIVTITF